MRRFPSSSGAQPIKYSDNLLIPLMKRIDVAGTGTSKVAVDQFPGVRDVLRNHHFGK